jgi:hypothetical protein
MDNIRMDLGEVRSGDVDWTGLAQDSNRWRVLVTLVLNLLETIKCPNNWGLSSSAQLQRVS